MEGMAHRRADLPRQVLELPVQIEIERRETFRRVLAGLPDRYLEALLDGLDHADVVVPGRLFAGEAGGCAVGVTLRTLHPELRWESGFRARRARSVTRLARDLAKRVGRLGTLERVFDRSVEVVLEHNRGAACGSAARLTAAWLEEEARAELARRAEARAAPDATPSDSPALARRDSPSLDQKVGALPDEARLALAAELGAALAATFGAVRGDAYASARPSASATASAGRPR